MNCIHDIWVNWSKDAEKGYDAYNFHEWRKDDGIQLVDQAPVIKVNHLLFLSIENSLDNLPNQLLIDVQRKGYMRKDHKRIQMEYCFLVSDGSGIIVINTDGLTYPKYKSRLIPRQEQMVHDMLDGAEVSEYDHEVSNCEYDYTTMIGLTRRERTLKKILVSVLEESRIRRNSSELKYYYSEFTQSSYDKLKQLSFEEVYELIFNKINCGWSAFHHKMCEQIIKGKPAYESLWNAEMDKDKAFK